MLGGSEIISGQVSPFCCNKKNRRNSPIQWERCNRGRSTQEPDYENKSKKKNSTLT